MLALSVFYAGEQCQLGGHSRQTLISALGEAGRKGKRRRWVRGRRKERER